MWINSSASGTGAYTKHSEDFPPAISNAGSIPRYLWNENETSVRHTHAHQPKEAMLTSLKTGATIPLKAIVHKPH